MGLTVEVMSTLAGVALGILCSLAGQRCVRAVGSKIELVLLRMGTRNNTFDS